MSPDEVQARDPGSLGDIATISFDGDQTLWDFRKAMQEALQETLTELQREVDTPAAHALSVASLVETRDRVAARLGEASATHEQIRHAALGETLAAIGAASDALRDALYASYMERRFALIEPYDDAIRTLDALRARYEIGLISNGNTYPERCGLEGKFDFVVFAHEVGEAKPSPRIFAEALRRAGCQAGELLHVGDSLETDVQGALHSEVRAIWLNREGQDVPRSLGPESVITTLAELVPLLIP